MPTKENRLFSPPKAEPAAEPLLTSTAKTRRRRKAHPVVAQVQTALRDTVMLFLVQNNLLAFVQRNLRFLLFLTGIGLLYVWNAHQAEKGARKADALGRQIKELKTEYMTLSAQLSVARQHSQIALRVDSLGLKPLSEPPFTLIVAKDR